MTKGDNSKQHVEPQPVEEALHDTPVEAPTSLDHWADKSVTCLKNGFDSTNGAPSSAAVASCTVGFCFGTCVLAIIRRFLTLDRGMPSPLVMLGAVAVVDTFNGGEFTWIARFRSAVKFPRKLLERFLRPVASFVASLAEHLLQVVDLLGMHCRFCL